MKHVFPWLGSVWLVGALALGSATAFAAEKVTQDTAKATASQEVSGDPSEAGSEADSGAAPDADSEAALDRILEESDRQDAMTPGYASVVNGSHESLDVPVVSWRDIPFKTVKRQAFDYSCGSAAVATLLTYIYGRKASEGEVFKAMFERGDKAKIRHEGFSLLDMRNYLNALGYKAKGYRLSLKAVERHKVPFIALINRDGYMHFVVVKSVYGDSVLVGDPSKGNVIFAREEFRKMWNGISLVVLNHARAARMAFADPREWTYVHSAAAPRLGENPGLDSASLPFPNWQIAPTRIDPLVEVSSAAYSVLNIQ